MAPQHRVPVILTRPLAQAERFARSLPAAAKPVFSPLLRIEALEADRDFAAFDGLIFTSENGVHAFNQVAPADGRIAYCVGDRTAEAAREAGFLAHSANGTAEDLVALVSRQDFQGRLLHVHGAYVRGDIAAQLGSLDIRIDDVALYDQVAQPLSKEAVTLLGEARSIVTLFSPRTAALFAERCPTAPEAQVICLSRAVAAALGGCRYAETSIAQAPNAPAMLAEVSCRVNR